MFEEFDLLISALITGQISQNFSVILGLIKPLWIACVALYILYLVSLTIYGKFSVQDLFTQITIFALIGAFLSAEGYYMKYVVPAVMNIGDTISGKILTTGGDSEYTSALGLVDKIISDAIKNMVEMWSAILEKSIGKIIADIVPAGIGTLFMLAGALVLTVFAGVYLILAKVMLAVILSMGSFVILFASIPQTRGYILPWVGQIMNYILLIVMFTIGFTIVNSAVIGISDFILISPDGALVVNPITFIMMSAMYIVGYALLNSVVGVASAIAGGANTFDSRGVGKGMNLAKGLGKISGKTVAQSAGLGLKGAVLGGKGIMSSGSKLAGMFKNGIKG